MGVLVKAINMGYYDHKRRREGQEFEIKDSDLKFDKEGKLASPKWVQLVDAESVKPKKIARAPKKEVAHVSDEEVI